MSDDIRKSSGALFAPGLDFVGGPRIPGQAPKLLLDRKYLRMQTDMSGINQLTKPAVPLDGPVYPGANDVIRSPADVTRGLGLDAYAQGKLEHRLQRLVQGSSLIEYRKSLVSTLREVAPSDLMLRSELGRRAIALWKGAEDSRPNRSIVGNTERIVLQKADRIPGGLAQGRPDSDFDPKALAEGVRVEMEHTTDRRIAKEIAKDHLTEDRHYYRKLATIEKAGPHKYKRRTGTPGNYKYEYDDDATSPEDMKRLGRTASGRTIYRDASHPSHSAFTAEDHADAIAAHMQEGNK